MQRGKSNPDTAACVPSSVGEQRGSGVWLELQMPSHSWPHLTKSWDQALCHHGLLWLVRLQPHNQSAPNRLNTFSYAFNDPPRKQSLCEDKGSHQGLPTKLMTAA